MAINPSLPLRRAPADQPNGPHYSARHERVGRHAQRRGSTEVPLKQQILRFGSIGVLSTGLHLGLFATLQHTFGAMQAANLVALLAATLANTALNRRWTFGVLGSAKLVRHQLQGLIVFGVTWSLSAIALWLLAYLVAHPSTIDQTLTVGVAMAISTVVRFAAMRSWMFGSPTSPMSSLSTPVSG
jgi:putative flippase GtrA